MEGKDKQGKSKLKKVETLLGYCGHRRFWRSWRRSFWGHWYGLREGRIKRVQPYDVVDIITEAKDLLPSRGSLMTVHSRNEMYIQDVTPPRRSRRQRTTHTYIFGEMRQPEQRDQSSQTTPQGESSQTTQQGESSQTTPQGESSQTMQQGESSQSSQQRQSRRSRRHRRHRQSRQHEQSSGHDSSTQVLYEDVMLNNDLEYESLIPPEYSLENCIIFDLDTEDN